MSITIDEIMKKIADQTEQIRSLEHDNAILYTDRDMYRRKYERLVAFLIQLKNTILLEQEHELGIGKGGGRA